VAFPVDATTGKRPLTLDEHASDSVKWFNAAIRVVEFLHDLVQVAKYGAVKESEKLVWPARAFRASVLWHWQARQALKLFEGRVGGAKKLNILT